jgi:hypothetical protein
MSRVRVFAFVSVLLSACSAAFALNARSAVSVTGSDSNPCTPALPCRSFVTAMTVTAAGGEIVALDSGGYGPFTISQSVTVGGAPGFHAAITAASGDAIHVTASPSDHVVLRNLVLIGAGGLNGIHIEDSGVADLNVSDVAISGFTNAGIIAGSASLLVVDHCQILDNPGNGCSLGNRAIIANSQIIEGNTGVAVTTGGIVEVKNSIVAGMVTGIQVSSFVGSSSSLVEGCDIMSNGTGVLAGLSGSGGISFLRLSNNSIFANTLGVNSGDGAVMYTFSNNRISGNDTDIQPALAFTPLLLR